jgi:hypothetical protein
MFPNNSQNNYNNGMTGMMNMSNNGMTGMMNNIGMTGMMNNNGMTGMMNNNGMTGVMNMNNNGTGMMNMNSNGIPGMMNMNNNCMTGMMNMNNNCMTGMMNTNNNCMPGMMNNQNNYNMQNMQNMNLMNSLNMNLLNNYLTIQKMMNMQNMNQTINVAGGNSNWEIGYKKVIRNNSGIPNKINCIFRTTKGVDRTIPFDFGKTVNQLIKRYLDIMGKPELIDNTEDICYLFNARQINPYDNTKVEVFFKENHFPIIVVNDIKELIGA